MDISQSLEKIGLKAKESQAYLELLRLGTQPASTIARHMSIPRSTAHFLLENLVKRRFCSHTKKGNTFLFTAEPPQNIIKILETEKEKEILHKNNQIDLLKKIAPEMEGMASKYTHIPKITFYEGEDGLINVYEDTLNAQETIRSFASFDAMHGTQPEYFDNYYQRRAKKGIFIRSIHPDTEIARERTKHNKAEFRDACLVPSEKYDFAPEIQLYDNKINIASWKEKLGIIIESEEIYKAFTVAFELAWAEAKRLEKESGTMNDE
jgi:sugar-specific transcriptional regulator TrmB